MLRFEFLNFYFRLPIFGTQATLAFYRKELSQTYQSEMSFLGGAR